MQAAAATTQEAISPQRLAKRLDVSIKTARSIIRSGKIRAHRIGRQWRVFESDLRDYLARQTNQRAA